MTTPTPQELAQCSDSYDVEGESVIATDDGLVLYEHNELPPS